MELFLLFLKLRFYLAELIIDFYLHFLSELAQSEMSKAADHDAYLLFENDMKMRYFMIKQNTK